jgi:ABC-type uncharacterized transport system ATPase subunit
LYNGVFCALSHGARRRHYSQGAALMRHYEIVLLLRVGVGVDMAERYKK